MEGQKRKGDGEGTIVTFYAPDRTFARVYKGQSLDETKILVRKKLGLPDNTSIHFARLHEGKVIELDDEDDFEAFRHLAKYVTSLDVSVIVGDAPRIFTLQSSSNAAAQASRSPKRKNKRSAPLYPPTAPSSHSPSAEPSAAGASTIGMDGVPKAKRRRKNPPGSEGASEKLMAPLFTTRIERGSEQSLPDRSRPIGQASKSSEIAQLAVTSPSLPSADTAPASTDPSAVARGSKRKRDEASIASTNLVPAHSLPVASSSRPPSPSSPIKKKRKKDKKLAAPSQNLEPEAPLKPKSKGKHKAMSADAGSVDASEQHAVSTERDKAAARKAEKKRAKKEKKEKGKDRDTEMEIDPSPVVEGTKRSKKRKPTDTTNPEGPAPSSDNTSTPQSEPSRSAQGQKRKKDKRNAGDAEPSTSGSSTAESITPHSAAPSQDKEKTTQSQTRKGGEVEGSTSSFSVASVSVASGGDSISIEAAAGKKKRRKTMGAEASPTVDPPTSLPDPPAPVDADATSSSRQEEQETVSAKKTKRERTKSSAASSQSHDSPSISAMAAVQSAYQAILARGSVNQSTSGPSPSPVAQAESSFPVRNNGRTKSKLSQSWVPDEQASVHSTSPAENSPLLEPTAPSEAPAKAKTDRSKKARPSAAPTCPICGEASLHPRSQCPVIEAGPTSIRKRITQLKKAGHDQQLVGELETLLKEAQRRRKTLSAPQAAVIPPPIRPPAVVPSEDAPSSPEPPTESVSTASARRPALPHRPVSSPRLPAGSEISEVAVESKDEGSSNEGSSDDEDDTPVPAPVRSLAATLPDPTNLEALLHGPVKPRVSILAQIPSSSSSESQDSNDEAGEDEEVDLEEEEKNEQAFRRMSRKFEREASSSDEEREPDNAGMNVNDVDPDPNDNIEVVGAQLDNGVPKVKAAGGDPSKHADSDKDAEEQTLDHDTFSVREGRLASESGQSEAGSAPDAPSVDHTDGSRVGDAAKKPPLAAQENRSAADDEQVPVPEEAKGDEELQLVDDPSPEYRDEVAGAEILEFEEDEVLPQGRATTTPNDAERELSPELGESHPTPRHASPAQVEEGEGPKSTALVEVEEVDPHTEDPEDPIEPFSPQPRKPVEEEDPIEAADATTPWKGHQTPPPPASPRTPGVVSRMRDRHGRLSQSPEKRATVAPSRRALTLSEEDLTLPPHEDADEQEQELDPEAQAEMEADPDADQEDGDAVQGDAEPQPEAAAESSQVQLKDATPEEVQTRPRRTTRITARGTSAMPPPSSLPEPVSTPTPAPTRRGRPRLSEEEKARREAEKAEKKAERDRKAAEAKATKDAKKAADKEAREAFKRAKKEEKEKSASGTKRGGAATRARGRGRGAKPVSTRSQRSAVSVESEEEEVAEGQGEDREPQAQLQASLRPISEVSGTPGTGKISWTTLPQTARRAGSESVGDVDGDSQSMVDELRPSSPESIIPGQTNGRRKASAPEHPPIAVPADVDGDHQPEEEGTAAALTPQPKKTGNPPLFMPSDSQFPETPFGVGALVGGDGPSEPDDQSQMQSQSQSQERTTMKAPSGPRKSWYSEAMFPKLSNLASQQLFASTQIPSPALFSQTPRAESSFRLKSTYVPNGDGDDDEDESSEDDDSSDSSDSDGGAEKKTKKSHIPRERRAGAGVQKEKKRGLLLSTFN